jgi:hypothetical protein
MDSCYIDRLSDDILCMIFKLVCEEDQATFDDSFQLKLNGVHWDDWGDDENYYYQAGSSKSPHDSDFLPPTLISAVAVSERWKCVLSQIPSIWTTLQFTFRQGAASLEHARTFLRLSGTMPLKIVLLWDDSDWIVPMEGDHGSKEPASRKGIMDSINFVSLILELCTHVHRWREFTLRTTSVAHTYQAVTLMSRSSVHPAHMLEKLHLLLVHNERHAAHHIHEPSLFPGSAPPIRDLMLFGIHWAWLSAPMLSSHLVDLRMHYDECTDHGTGSGNVALLPLLGELPNLERLSLEVELPVLNPSTTHSITLPQLSSLTIKSGSMRDWADDFFHCAQMPNLRILTLDGDGVMAERTHGALDGIIRELVRLTDPGAMMEDSSSCLLELDELHLLHFTHHANAALIHRLYTQMATVEVLTLGPGAGDNNVALAMGLSPTPYRMADLPLPGLRKLVVFDVPEDVMRSAILERVEFAGQLEELHYSEPWDKRNTNVPNDWHHQVEKYYSIGGLGSYRYCDIVGRRWSELQ